MATLVNENKFSEAKGTPMEEAVEANFRGETSEVGLYLAMAWQAQREGLPEVGEALKTIAWEEAQHALRFALLNGKISLSTKENLEKIRAIQFFPGWVLRTLNAGTELTAKSPR